MNFELIQMSMSNNPDFVSVIRLTTAGIASKIGFDMEDIEDLKVAVSEACTNAIKHSREKNFEVKFYIYSDKLEIEVVDEGVGYDVESVKEPDLSKPATSGLGLFIIKSLMDFVDIKSCGDCGTVIKFTKTLGVDN